MAQKRWDVFISHADADKQAFVLPLAEALRERGYSVWFDTWAMRLGESISESISAGLANSRFGVVVLSKAFFAHAWPKKELASLFALEGAGASRIVPLWHELDHNDVLTQAPLLADRLAGRSDEGIPALVARIGRLLESDTQTPQALNPEALRALTKHLFPHLRVDEFWQAQLLADLDTVLYRTPADIERAYRRAEKAVTAFKHERPDLFRSGTDYLTKALGFVDLCFRSRHAWAQETLRAFERHASKVDWNIH